MTALLALSSWVAAGHVGLSAITPAAQALGARVVGLPTTVLSNHKAWPAVAGGPTPPETLRAMLDAVAENGWLAGLDAALTGYLPTPDHVAVAAEALARLRAESPGARIVVDPVLGDDPKGLYLPEETAAALRDRLAPLADVITPNRFELAWLTGAPVDTLDEATAAARALAPARVLVTSPPLPAGATGVLAIGPEGARLHRTARREAVPHGVGDVFAGLVSAGVETDAAVGMLASLAEESVGRPHLRLAETAIWWTGAEPVQGEPL